MSVLPSPIPHPLDHAPWDVPGWIYEALDWVVGVQWPEGNERAVWDVADQWYAVASVLAGPHTDAATAAVEVHNGYGGVGAVDAAFEAAWRGIAEGADAPLPVLLAVTADLGRLVEECGCDIEGAKLEVWIELGILVVELLSVAVAAVLTAGAATPAAGAAITATRLLVQQIFKRLMGQLASKSLKHGLKEAGERAAKEVARGGVRGLAKRAAREGLEEATEESRGHPGHPGVPELHRAGTRPGPDRPRRLGGRRARRRGGGAAGRPGSARDRPSGEGRGAPGPGDDRRGARRAAPRAWPPVRA